MHVLARALRGIGVELRRVVMILDEVDEIAREVAALSGTHDWLFTSGGVGPTHDDVTVTGVAKAFGVEAVESPVLAAMLREHYKERRSGNPWLLPGVPEIFRLTLPVAIARIGGDVAFVTRAVYTKMDEGDLRPLLDAIVERFPDVAVGSYPKWLDPMYKTKLTFDGRDPARVDAARDAFVALLPAGEPQRTE